MNKPTKEIQMQDLIDRFQAYQGWSDRTVFEFLKSFIISRQGYWPVENPMLRDLEAMFQNVADVENGVENE